MSNLADLVTAVWLGACLCGALAEAKIGFVDHDILLFAVSSAASLCLVWLIGRPAASWIWRRRRTAAARVVAGGGREDGPGNPTR